MSDLNVSVRNKCLVIDDETVNSPLFWELAKRCHFGGAYGSRGAMIAVWSRLAVAGPLHRDDLAASAGVGVDVLIAGVELGLLVETPAGLSLPGSDKPVSRSQSAADIYAAYPRKVGKAAALRAIERAIKRIPKTDAAEWLMARTKEFAASPAGKKGIYTPHPATWFNQGRYDDDPREWRRVEGEFGLPPINTTPMIPGGHS